MQRRSFFARCFCALVAAMCLAIAGCASPADTAIAPAKAPEKKVLPQLSEPYPVAPPGKYIVKAKCGNCTFHDWAMFDKGTRVSGAKCFVCGFSGEYGLWCPDKYHDRKVGNPTKPPLGHYMKCRACYNCDFKGWVAYPVGDAGAISTKPCPKCGIAPLWQYRPSPLTENR